jgi:hypothetical protein
VSGLNRGKIGGLSLVSRLRAAAQKVGIRQPTTITIFMRGLIHTMIRLKFWEVRVLPTNRMKVLKDTRIQRKVFWVLGSMAFRYVADERASSKFKISFD